VAVEFNPFQDLKSSDSAALYELYKALRENAPVHWSDEGEIFCVSRYEDVRQVLKDPENFSSEAMRTVLNSGLVMPMTPRYLKMLFSFMLRIRLNPLTVIKAGNLISLDGKRHTELRKVVGRGFTPRSIAAWQPRIEAVVEEHVAKIRKRDRIDVVEDLAVPLPTIIVAEMLGVEAERREDFKNWSSRIIDLASGAAKANVLESGVLDDVGDLFLFLRREIKKRRKGPRDDLISVLVDPAQETVLGDLDVVMFVVLLLVAGNETTTNLIGNAVNALIDHPRQLDKLLDDPSLIPGLVEETLRFESPLSVVFRNTTRPVQLAGVTLPKGKNVALLMASANRDETQFSNPDQFDIERDASGHLGFGFGVHFCLGSSLARLEATAALAALVPELRGFRRQGRSSELIDSFLVRGRQSLELIRR
jgi:cytochrome P450